MKLKGTGSVYKKSNENDDFILKVRGRYTSLIDKRDIQLGEEISYEEDVLLLYEESITNLDIKGDILLVGLGNAMLYYNWKDLPGVKSVTAIEIEQGVIDLVKPFFPSIKYICADAFEYTTFDTNDRYDTIFLDIFHKKVDGYEDKQRKLIDNYKRFIRNWRNVKDFRSKLSYLHIHKIDLDYLL